MGLEISRRLIGGKWRTASGDDGGGNDNGGSSSVRVLDLGVVESADLYAGPITLYTPDAGEVVGPVFLRDVVFPDNFAVVISRDEQVDTADPATFQPPLAGLDNDTSYDSAAAPVMRMGGSTQFAGQPHILPTTTGPVKAALALNLPPAQPIAPWQAGHDYDASETSPAVIEAGHIWESSDSFTSGGSKPDFAGNIGGSVSDGAGTWNDDGVAPTGASMHVYAYATVPVAP